PFHTDADLDVNGDGKSDFRFTSGSFVAALRGYGENKFISTLAAPPDQAGYVIPAQAGSLIGAELTSIGGDWQHHTDNVSNPSLSTGFGLRAMQYVSAYIGVSFHADDGLHYGWIHY